MEQQNALFRGQQNYPKNGLMSRMSRIGSDRYLLTGTHLAKTRF